MLALGSQYVNPIGFYTFSYIDLTISRTRLSRLIAFALGVFVVTPVRF